ncbi:MAG: diguanylate cyclase [Actinomycetota bacterium]|nr:diguanylate cyclase [Actinomycetota bacterium]
MDRVQTPLAAIAVSLVAAIAAWAYRPLILASAAASLVCAWALIRAHRSVTKTASAPEPGLDETPPLAPSLGMERLNSFQEHLSNDPDTGFITYPVFAAILEAKVATARRRLWPVTVVQLELGLGADAIELSDVAANSILGFSALMRATVREADVCARIGKYRFALILEDTDEEGGAWAAERLQVAHVRSGVTLVEKISAGVAGYPTNGATPKELLSRSNMALERALASLEEPGVGRVVVAPSVPYKG